MTIGQARPPGPDTNFAHSRRQDSMLENELACIEACLARELFYAIFFFPFAFYFLPHILPWGVIAGHFSCFSIPLLFPIHAAYDITGVVTILPPFIIFPFGLVERIFHFPSLYTPLPLFSAFHNFTTVLFSTYNPPLFDEATHLLTPRGRKLWSWDWLDSRTRTCRDERETKK